jgi:hypothetical protein
MWDFAVGAPYADNGLLSDAGAAYVFQGSASLNGTASSQQAGAAAHGNERAGASGWSVQGLKGFNSSSATWLFSGAPLSNGAAGGAVAGNVTGAIPEFGELAGVLIAVGAVTVARIRRGKRRPSP